MTFRIWREILKLNEHKKNILGKQPRDEHKNAALDRSNKIHNSTGLTRESNREYFEEGLSISQYGYQFKAMNGTCLQADLGADGAM